MRGGFLLLLLATFTLSLNAQKDVKAFVADFGFLVSSDINYIKSDRSDWNQLGIADEINQIELLQRVGFSLGIFSKIRLSPMVSIVPQAIVSLQSSRIAYDIGADGPRELLVAPATLEFPVHLTFTKPGVQKLKPSITFGGRYITDISSEDDAGLQFGQHDFALDLGIGMRWKNKSFTVQPELLYSFGLSNLREPGSDILSQSFDGIYRDKISLRFMFYRI